MRRQAGSMRISPAGRGRHLVRVAGALFSPRHCRDVQPCKHSDNDEEDNDDDDGNGD